jgi:hypothetical protein
MASKKKVKVIPRRVKVGLAAAPTNEFRWFNHYLRIDVSKKELAGVTRNYIGNNFKGEEQKYLLSGPEWVYSYQPGVAAAIEWQNRGHELPEDWNFKKQIANFIDDLRFWTDRAIEKRLNGQDSDAPKLPQRTPMDYMQEKTSLFIGEIEGIIDEWENHPDFSLYSELQKIGASAYTARTTLEFFNKRRLEIEELVKNKTPDLVEAYRFMKLPQQKKYLAFYEAIVADGKKYLLGKKAQRKPVTPRTKSADKQVAKVQYLKSNVEFKLTSINPISVIGQMRLYTFNAKDRTVTEYVCDETKGFQINGTSIKNFNKDHSRSIKLRKPEEALTIFQTKTFRQIDKYWNTLTTKTTVPNGRLNKDTILLRALDQ